MKTIPNICFNFSKSSYTDNISSPTIESVCSYPLRQHRQGNLTYSKHWAIEYHAKDAGETHLKTSSEICYKREAKTLHIYAPGCAYWENTHLATLPIQENYFIFDDGPHPALTDMIDPKHLFAQIHTESSIFEELFIKAAHHCATLGDRAFWISQSILMELIHHIKQAQKDNNGNWFISENMPDTHLAFSKKVDTYLRKNIDSPLKTADIASYMKVSESSLNHKYKQETGIAPIAKFIEMRIDFAKGLLLKGEMLKIIAQMTGFHDEYHLSKTFKKKTGQSPKAFKNKFMANVTNSKTSTNNKP